MLSTSPTTANPSSSSTHAWRSGFFAAAAVLALALAGSPAAAEEQNCVGKPSDTRASVTIENVRSNDGQMTITVSPDDSNRFLKHKGSLYVRPVPATAPGTHTRFPLP